jgi:ankyrin repeat protein
MKQNSGFLCCLFSSSSDCTPLHYSAATGNLAICRLLLQLKANLEAKGEK